jgi:hypothetical protein
VVLLGSLGQRRHGDAGDGARGRMERRARAVLCSVQAHSLAEIDSGMTAWGQMVGRAVGPESTRSFLTDVVTGVFRSSVACS